MGEVPRDDLADDAQRLVEVVGDQVLVDLADRALLGAQRAGEVAEVVDRERDVGGEGLADRLAVLPGLGDRDGGEVGSITSAIFSRMLARSVVEVFPPHDGAAAWAASRAASMSSSVPRAISVNGLPLTGEMFSK